MSGIELKVLGEWEWDLKDMWNQEQNFLNIKKIQLLYKIEVIQKNTKKQNKNSSKYLKMKYQFTWEYRGKAGL